MTAHFHFAEHSFTLHLLFKGAQCLLNVIIAYIHFYQGKYPLPQFIRLRMAFLGETPSKGKQYPVISAQTQKFYAAYCQTAAKQALYHFLSPKPNSQKQRRPDHAASNAHHQRTTEKLY